MQEIHTKNCVSKLCGQGKKFKARITLKKWLFQNFELDLGYPESAKHDRSSWECLFWIILVQCTIANLRSIKQTNQKYDFLAGGRSRKLSQKYNYKIIVLATFFVRMVLVLFKIWVFLWFVGQFDFIFK